MLKKRICVKVLKEIVTKLTKILIGIRDPGSEIRDPGSEIRDPGKNLFRIPDPGVKKAPYSGSRIRIHNKISKFGKNPTSRQVFSFLREACSIFKAQHVFLEQVKKNKNAPNPSEGEHTQYQCSTSEEIARSSLRNFSNSATSLKKFWNPFGKLWPAHTRPPIFSSRFTICI
jgi:hypothetical protein